MSLICSDADNINALEFNLKVSPSIKYCVEGRRRYLSWFLKVFNFNIIYECSLVGV